MSIQAVSDLRRCKSAAVTNGIIIDIDTLLETQHPAQTIISLNKLRERNAKMSFVSSTTTKTTENVCKRLQELKLHFYTNEVITNLNAMEHAVWSRHLEPMLLLDTYVADKYKTLGRKDGKIDAIVIGHAPNMFKYDILNTAFKYLINGAALLSLCRNQYMKNEKGRSLIGASSFIKAFENAAACEAEYIGMGSDFFFQLALGDLNPQEVIMVTNDYNLVTDILRYRMKAYFIQEHAYTRNELVIPNGIYRTFIDAANDLYMKLV